MSVLMLHGMITTTIEKYEMSDNEDLHYKTRLKTVLQGIEQEYPVTFICTLNPNVNSNDIAKRVDEMLSSGQITQENVDADPMVGKLLKLQYRSGCN